MWVAFQQRIIANEHLQEVALAPSCLSKPVLWLQYLCKVQHVVKSENEAARENRQGDLKAFPALADSYLAYRKFPRSKLKSLKLRKIAKW